MKQHYLTDFFFFVEVGKEQGEMEVDHQRIQAPGRDPEIIEVEAGLY